jgi:DNA-binding GntR family transcriptional regulator
LAYLSYGNEIDPDRSLQTHYQSVVREHETIIETLKKRDENRLKKTVHQHVATFQERIIRYMAF